MFKLWQKSLIHWFDINICIWKGQGSSKWKRGVKCNNIAKQYKNHIPKWLQIPVHTCKVLVIGGSGFGKTTSLFNLKDQQPDIDKNLLYGKDPCKAKYQFWISKRESADWKHFKDLKTFIENSNDIYKNIGEYDPNKKCKILIHFDDMVADINPVVIEVFIRGRKLNILSYRLYISYRYIMQIIDCFYHTVLFFCSQNIRLDPRHYFILKILKKETLLLVINATLASDNPPRFRRIF